MLQSGGRASGSVGGGWYGANVGHEARDRIVRGDVEAVGGPFVTKVGRRRTMKPGRRKRRKGRKRRRRKWSS